MPDKKEELQEPVEVQETVDFDNSESRMKFLKSQLNDLLDGINNVYGQDLMEELLKRLEKTVEEFNTEVSSLITRLKDGKILDVEEIPEESTDEVAEATEEGEEGEDGDPEKSFEQQEADDSDIIARMRARVTKD